MNNKELLLAALEYSFGSVGEIAGVSEEDFKAMRMEDILTAFERIHTEYYALHEELEGLRHSDADVKKLYDDFEETALRSLYDGFSDEVKNRPHSWEDLKIAIGLMENYCHTYMNESMSEEELSYMKNKTIKMVKAL